MKQRNTVAATAVLGVLIAAPAWGSKPLPFEFPGEPGGRASYTMLAIEGDGPYIATTRRVSSMFTSFSRREIHCDTGKQRYVGDGESLDQARKPLKRPDKLMVPVEGSSAWQTVKAVCSWARSR